MSGLNTEKGSPVPESEKKLHPVTSTISHPLNADSINSEDIEHIKHDHKVIDLKDADATLQFMNVHDSQVPEITQEQEKKLSRKVLVRILGLTFLINLIMYMDKAALSYSSLDEMGFWEATGLDQNKYNNCNTLFYVGFLVGQIPGPYITQKIPLSKLMFMITVLWSIIIFLHATAYNYAGVMVLRFFLGLTEASAIPIMTSTNAMFLNKLERDSTAPVFYSSCLGSSIPIGFIAYGVLFAHAKIGGYRVLNIIIGGLTLLLSVIIYFWYPNNPVDAKFFTTEEKVWIIRRVQSTTNSSVDQNKFKKSHAIEALKDYITWLFCLVFFLQQLANNLPYQQSLLYANIGGITNLDSTLVTVASSGFSVLWAWGACLFMVVFPNTSFLTGIWSVFPALLGSILAVSLPYDNSIGMLGAICMASQTFGVQWIICFYLSKATARSQTKSKVRAACMMAAFSISNIISPQLWQKKDAPRYIPAWIVQIVFSFGMGPIILGVIWFILKRRNDKRLVLAEVDKTNNVGLVKDDEGNEVIVNVAALDLTDLEDKSFIYPL